MAGMHGGTCSLALAPTNASQGQWIRSVGTLGKMAKQPLGMRVPVNGTVTSAGVTGVGFPCS